ncbi:hypothetical protein GOP47_0029243 [Adiantum capillus-veneris]|nr:hypothetical protein GOP47_0029243 [Adiantum capillus-veneris]
MFSLMESNIGYGNAGAETAAAAATGAPFMRSRESYNQHAPMISYTQMLRMFMEEEGAEDMGSSMNCSRESYCSYMQVKEERGEEGYAENDYDLTCLTLGLGRPASDVISARVEPLGLSNLAGTNEALPVAAGRINNSSGFTRTCSLCGTSKTPLWRSGPLGAKSLCNACGIRSKKAKKIAAALHDEEQTAANFSQKKGAGSKQVITAAKSKAVKRKMTVSKGGEMEMAKKKKQQLPQLYVNVCSPVKTEASSCVTSPGTPSPRSTQRKPFSSSVFNCLPHADDALFPKDEEQAAFLLMALSCGLVLAN